MGLVSFPVSMVKKVYLGSQFKDTVLYGGEIMEAGA